MIQLHLINDSITFTDYQKTLFYLISYIVQVWKVENAKQCCVCCPNLKLTVMKGIYVTGFAKRGLIHASNFATLMRHNFICGSAMKLKFTVSLV